MKKILLVDDDQNLRAVLINALKKKGYQIAEASSGSAGIQSFTQNSPDLVISDVSMPEMDGFEFCRRLRAEPSGQLVPFIFLSARDDIEDRVQGHSIGADDYLTKPFEIKELFAKIEALIEKSRRINSEIIHLLESMSRDKLQVEQNNSQQNNSEGNGLDRNPDPLPLTPAEARVFWEVIQGFTNKHISERLFISPRTVQTHLSNIMNKLNLENRTQLVRFAFEKGYEKVQF